MPKKKTKIVQSGTLTAYEIRAMELRYYGLSFREIEKKLKEDEFKDSKTDWKLLAQWFREGGKLHKTFYEYCSKINDEKINFARKQLGRLTEEANRTIIKAIKNGNVKLAERVSTQIGVLEPETQALPTGTLSYEKLMISNEPENNPKIKGKDDAIEGESEVVHQGAVED
jgi:DNA polymerase III delta prime subunit